MLRRKPRPKPTATEQERMDAIAGSECLACRLRREGGLQSRSMRATVHHLTGGGRHGQPRRGHRYTVALCPWHHQGVPNAREDERSMARKYGPSYAREPRRFREEIADDDTLLALQDDILGWVGCES